MRKILLALAALPACIVVTPQQPAARPYGGGYNNNGVAGGYTAGGGTTSAGGGYTGGGGYSGGGRGNVFVNCQFDRGWASLLPEAEFRQDDFLMQVLIGMTEDPSFWRSDRTYSRLAPYAARPCSGGVTFPVSAGRYYLLVGRTDTFDERGDYRDNGYYRLIEVTGDATYAIYDRDLTHTWLCISCPHIYAWDGDSWEHKGEILKDIIGAAAERSQRTPLGEVRVIGGEVRLRVAEQEEEISHVNSVLLEIGGRSYAPTEGPLTAADASYQTLKRGEAVELVFKVGLPDGPVKAEVLASGYYVPLLPVR
jgi:hypothetical protein